MARPSLERLNEIITYEPESGSFRWKTNRGKARAGNPAGYDHQGYVQIEIDGNKILAHHLVWFFETGEWPKFIDHKNLNRRDNHFSNLRLASPSQNIANIRKRSDNKSGYKGVYWVNRHQKWRAQCGRRHVGDFDCPTKAALAYDSRAKEMYGEYARTNFS